MSPSIALLLGVVQGLTEFLPISSSGHLMLVESFFDLTQTLTFDFVCHLGTLFSLLVLMGRDLWTLFREEKRALILGTVPLCLAPFLHLDGVSLGICFLLTALLLFLGEYRVKEASKLDGLWIGLFQLAALFPGISRSGSTISGARLLGWEKEKAVRFSFLLVVPALFGGCVLQGWEILRGEVETEPLSCYLIGFFAAFVTGLFGLAFLLRLIKKGRLTPFMWYCLILGVITLVWIR